MAKKSDDFERLKQRLTPKVVAWRNFEAEVTGYLRNELSFANLGLNPATADVIAHPRYYSKHRESEITFDVGIEVRPFDRAQTPTLVWLWECKDYPDRNVSVDEVEEFHDKLVQVGAHKGTIVTRCGFSSGAISVAKSYGIALLTLVQEQVTMIAFSQQHGLIDRLVIRPTLCIAKVGESHSHLEDYVEAELAAAGLMNW